MINTNTSGGVRVALEYAQELAVRGHDVFIMTPTGNERFRFITSMRVKFIDVHYRSIYPVFKNLQLIIKFIFDLRFFLNKKNEDFIVFAPSWHSVLIALIAGIQPKNILFLIQHDDDIINEGRGVKKLINSILYKWVYKQSTQRLTVSTWLQNLFLNKYNVTCKVLLNGVSRQKFNVNETFNPWVINPGAFKVLCIGRSTKWKGFADLCNAIRILRNKGEDFELIIATHENIDIPKDIPNKVVRPDNDLELGACYRSATTFVCSSWVEGFGLPPLEAMCNGVPVVTTKCGGVEDFAFHEVNCLLVEPHSAESIANALLRLKYDHSLLLKLSEGGFETSKQFSLINSINNLELLLSEIYLKQI